MSTRVKIAPALQENFNVPGIIEVSGNTVGECLDDLIRQYPEARSWLYEKDGIMRVLVSINNKETVIPGTDDADRTINRDDELQIFAVVAGG